MTEVYLTVGFCVLCWIVLLAAINGLIGGGK